MVARCRRKIKYVSKTKEELLNRSELRKIQKSPRIKTNSNPTVSLDEDERKRQIQRFLKSIKYSIYCPAINDNVGITSKSQTESSVWGKKNSKSVTAIYNINDLLKFATLVRKGKPKQASKQQKSFEYVYYLSCKLKGVGLVKIMIGEFYKLKKDLDTKFILYSATYQKYRNVKSKKKPKLRNRK